MVVIVNVLCVDRGEVVGCECHRYKIILDNGHRIFVVFKLHFQFRLLIFLIISCFTGFCSL